VDGQEFASGAEAREAATAALRALDGDASAHVYVEHGSARFEVAGSAGKGLVCHRNPDVSTDVSWAVLVRIDQAADNSVEVPMGDVKGFLPLWLVQDLPSVEVRFLISLRPLNWRRLAVSGSPGMRLGTRA
jgi:hypothetical protein